MCSVIYTASNAAIMINPIMPSPTIDSLKSLSTPEVIVPAVLIAVTISLIATFINKRF